MMENLPGTMGTADDQWDTIAVNISEHIRARMLQQILRDMYIEPELLVELSEEQKQYLFVKMREEQIRRWKERETEYEENEKIHPKKASKPGNKKVQFLYGHDGNEWVWVMGEHANDKTIQHILEDEAQARAKKQADKETQELRRKEEDAWVRQMEEKKKRLEKEKEETEMLIKRKKEEAALYQSIKEAQLIAKKLEGEKRLKELEEKKKMDELQVVNERQRRKSVEKYDNMRHRRSSEIYIKWKEMRSQLEKAAEENNVEVEASWKEQEKKSKEAEKKMRELARKARKEYKESMKRTSQLIQAARAFADGGSASVKPQVPPKKHITSMKKSSITKWTKRPARPPNQMAVVSWFQQEERPRGSGLNTDNKIATWFHGIISRSEAETLLNNSRVGSFLVRVSERLWGYTISYRDADRIKHFLVDTTDGGYQFLGASQIQHSSLCDLVSFHKDNAITVSGGELLMYECGQSGETPDYAELFRNEDSQSTDF